MKTKDLNNNTTNMLHMKQKDYNLEIVNELLKGENYLRGLASKMGTNPMMVSRKLGELFHLNVVDYKLQGKNKVYFLKKTAESKCFVFMSEHYKLALLLKKYPSLRNIIDVIHKNNKIHLASFFGSYTKGFETSKSDVDIYVETNNPNIKKELERIDSKLSVKIGKYSQGDFLIKEIEKSHVIIKGVEEYYEKNKFFD